MDGIVREDRGVHDSLPRLERKSDGVLEFRKGVQTGLGEAVLLQAPLGGDGHGPGPTGFLGMTDRESLLLLPDSFPEPPKGLWWGERRSFGQPHPRLTESLAPPTPETFPERDPVLLEGELEIPAELPIEDIEGEDIVDRIQESVLGEHLEMLHDRDEFPCTVRVGE